MTKLLTVLTTLIISVSTQVLYPKTAVVVDIVDDVLVLEDSVGFTWEMDGIEDYQRRDVVSLMMFDNGTDIIFDDVIVSAQYSGYHVELY